ncbi:unnamed protein product [marine sediment metagenome]|uniref:HNH domain-containing protein n=1 Tax=marine sediment metagenome TaxID=412755 RepID=X0SCE3_9ZZZZ
MKRYKTKAPRGKNNLAKTALEMMRSQQSKHGYNFCEKCTRSDKGLSIHHIVYRSERPKHPMLHEKINLIILCTFHED